MALKDITSSTTKYKVVSGDTFSAIAKRCIDVDMPGYSGLSLYNAGINRLKQFNPDIENINYISIGQIIVLQGTANKKTTNNTQRVKITNIGVQSDTDRTVFATWSWSNSKTDHYEVVWRYNTKDNIPGGFPGSTETVTEKLSLWSGAPENATCVTLKVRPVSTTYKSGNKEEHYWTADWSTIVTYNFADNPPMVPPKPTDITISTKHKLTVKLTELELNAKKIQFEIEKDGVGKYKTGTEDIKDNKSCTFYTTVAPGANYKVRCRSFRDGMYSEWSAWSDAVPSNPAKSAGFESITAVREIANQENRFMVRLRWFTVSSADNYIIEYTKNEEYFDSNQTEVTTVDMGGSKSDPIEVDHTEILLDGGVTYFFRICAVTNGKNGDWSEVEAIILGEKPTAPTTWSSTTSAITGEPLTLYWVHNSKDGSSQTSAQLELTITGIVDGVYKNDTEVLIIENTAPPEDVDKTSTYEIDTTKYAEGVRIKWRVQTAGIRTDHETGEPLYGDWSAHREIVVYAEPTIDLVVTDYTGSSFTELAAFPINISATAGPSSQKPISYHLSVIANEDYPTIDNTGNETYVVTGTALYSKYFDTSDNPLTEALSAGDLSLDNNRSYTIICNVCMDSGLSTEERKEFAVAWNDVEELWPNASIIYDKSTYTTSIKPYCRDLDENLIDGVTLTVYRREFDGTFTELDTVNNIDEVYITDPHPSLDYARYRIVAKSDATGAVSYYDMPGFPIREPSAIIQWDEEWANFNLTNEATFEEQPWSGSLLKLTYNIDVSDQHEKDTDMIKYVGREHPVAYYGTQLGHTSTWNTVVRKDDEETLYALRRLARWMGTAYVREPSGSGYWAEVKVSFNRNHKETTMPVTLDITRVEGGV